MSNTLKTLNTASNNRPSISDLAEPIPAVTTPEEAITEDSETKLPLVSFNFDEDAATSVSQRGVRAVAKLDADILRAVEAFLDHTRKDGRTNYNAFREDGALHITSAIIPNLTDPEVWKLARESFAAALSGRGLHKYDPNASYSVNTGSFNIGGSRHELKADGTPQSYPSTLRLSITRHSDAVIRDRIKSGS